MTGRYAGGYLQSLPRSIFLFIEKMVSMICCCWLAIASGSAGQLGRGIVRCVRGVEDRITMSIAQSSSLYSNGQPRESEKEEKQRVSAEPRELCAQLVSVCGGRWRALEGAEGPGIAGRRPLARRPWDESPRCHRLCLHPIDKHMASCSRKHSVHVHPPQQPERVTSRL
jgi:hypothetical protein